MMPIALRARCALGRAAALTRAWGLRLASQGTAIATSSSPATTIKTVSAATPTATTPTATSGSSKQKPKTKKPTTAYFVGGLPPDSTVHCRFVECEKARPSWTVERLVREALPKLNLLDADGKTPLLSRDSLVFHVSAELATSPSTTAEQLISGGKKVDLFTLLRDLQPKTRRLKNDPVLNAVYFYAKAKPTVKAPSRIAASASSTDASTSTVIAGALKPPVYTRPLNYKPIATRVEERKLPDGNGAAVLVMPDKMRWPTLSVTHLFKRDFYDRFIEEKLFNFDNLHGNRRILVTGTTDTGKSSFALYCLWKALQMGKTVVYQSGSNPKYYKVFEPGCDFATELHQRPAALRERDAVYIADEVEPIAADAFTLLVSSPVRKVMHDWMKEVDVYYFPTWTFDELKLMRTHCFQGRSASYGDEDTVALTDEELQKRFNSVGGLLRPIFYENFWKEFTSSVKGMPQNLAFYMSIRRLDYFDLYLNFHYVIHFAVSKTIFKISHYDFASLEVRQGVATGFETYTTDILQRFLDYTRHANPRYVAIRELAFEILVRRYLTQTQGMWTAHAADCDISSAPDTTSSAVLHMPLPGRPATHFDRVEDIQPGEPNVAMLWYNAALDHRLFIVTVGAHVYFLQCDVCTVYKDVRSQRFAHIAYPEGVGAGAVAVSPALLPLAAALALRGFDTAGDIILVHVKEKHNRVKGLSFNVTTVVTSSQKAKEVKQLEDTDTVEDLSCLCQWVVVM